MEAVSYGAHLKARVGNENSFVNKKTTRFVARCTGKKMQVHNAIVHHNANSVLTVNKEVKEEKREGVYKSLEMKHREKDHTTTLSYERMDMRDAIELLEATISELCDGPSPSSNHGVLRFQVPIKKKVKALQWLQSQPKELPCCYFSSRASRSSTSPPFLDSTTADPSAYSKSPKAVGGVGAALRFGSSDPFSLPHWSNIKRFLPENSPLIRAYGCLRFDPDQEPSSEWTQFKSFYFVIPQVELDEFENECFLAATIAWDDSSSTSFKNAIHSIQKTLYQISSSIEENQNHFHSKIIRKTHIPDQQAWATTVDCVLEALSISCPNKFNRLHSDSLISNKESLSKVVLARSTKVELDQDICSLRLLNCLQEKDETAYQFCFRLPEGPAFIGNTPEQLFYRKGLMISSEAVAATRHRGRNVEEDRQIAHSLLCSEKEHNEFDIVRKSVKKYLEAICHHVEMKPEKIILKQTAVQHLYACILGELKTEAAEFNVLTSLHPTPAVGGSPQRLAKAFINKNEMFDRGMYAGPVGWFGAKESEFAVGIRSALVQDARHAIVYAGAGIVIGSNPSNEWNELELKSSQFVNLLQPSCSTSR